MKKLKNSKRVLSIVLSIALVLSAITISGPGNVNANGSDNLVSNGGFDTVSDWKDNSTGTPTAVGEQGVSTVKVPNYIAEQHFEDEAEYKGKWRNQSDGILKYVEDGANHVLKYTSSSGEKTFDFHNNHTQIFEAGKKYTLSYKYKSDVSFHAYHANLESGWTTYGEWVPASETWKEMECTIEPTADALLLGEFQIGFQLQGAG